MGMELLNLAVFFGLTTCFHCLNKKLEEKHKLKVGTTHGIMAAGVLSHPVTWESIQHYLIHLVVYSGYILPKH